MKQTIDILFVLILRLGLPLIFIALATWGVARLCRSLGIWSFLLPAVFVIAAIVVMLIAIVLIEVWRPL
jgi:phosphoglycerol transferase MdoB-like AlkP superfamily enzyme